MPRELYETELPAERAVLVYINSNPEDDYYVELELESLCAASGIIQVGSIRQRIEKPSPSTVIGKGKIEELLSALHDTKADCAIFDCELNSVQQRNLIDALHMKVIDRTQLILDIFAQRAHTKEGMLQVELAQLLYMMPKITSVYTRFEQQRGGIGLRGPGETKLEVDRRHINQRIANLKRELEEVRRHRSLQRQGRRRVPFPCASLVGYTSAGKSTLMNTLTGSKVFSDPMLFATLDPTTRRAELQNGVSVFLTDTVGFVRKLPTNLIAAFRATLEEVNEADILIHVIDISSPIWDVQRDAVMDTLTDIGATGKPMLTVFNKIDRVKDRSWVDALVESTPKSVAVSATQNIGINELKQLLIKMIHSLYESIDIIIPYAKSALVEDFYKYGRVLKIEHEEDGIHILAEIAADKADSIRKNIAEVR